MHVLILLTYNIVHVLMSLFAWNCCISVQAGIGNIAINDYLLIEATIYKLLKKYVSHKPYYVDVLHLFHEVSACNINSGLYLFHTNKWYKVLLLLLAKKS